VNKKILILIADDHPIVRERLSHALNHQSDMCVIAEASDGAEVCQLYDKLSPDLLGCLLKEAEPDELWDTIRKVFAGDVVLPLTVSGKLAASLAEPQLSAREMQVLRQLCVGDSNKEIAQKNPRTRAFTRDTGARGAEVRP
jgi:DNA-binding NarL/FixJ family response regulator